VSTGRLTAENPRFATNVSAFGIAVYRFNSDVICSGFSFAEKRLDEEN
jgi:hypothetical protein